MTRSPKPSPAPGATTKAPPGGKDMPPAKTISEENKETRKGGK
ncbi:hypothetical protein [Xinfangfangia pollutisoli]|nr:hypothetical protein [Xinfangfangia pollutisoli]